MRYVRSTQRGLDIVTPRVTLILTIFEQNHLSGQVILRYGEGMTFPVRIGIIGPAGAGKDATYAAIQALNPDFRRAAFGDHVKCVVDAEVRVQYGVSAFTSDRAEKAVIRPYLERRGDELFETDYAAFAARVPLLAVNTRVQREPEARAWLTLPGAFIVRLHRPGTEPATPLEADYLRRMSYLVEHDLHNDGDLADLRFAAHDLLTYARCRTA